MLPGLRLTVTQLATTNMWCATWHDGPREGLIAQHALIERAMELLAGRIPAIETNEIDDLLS
jgi:hypothetical protein